jgi:hypothetical protein
MTEPANPAKLWLKAAFIAGIIAVTSNAASWFVLLRLEPMRPSVVWDLSGVGAWSLLIALALGVITAIRNRGRKRYEIMGTLAFIGLLLPSCFMLTMLGGPPGETVQLLWQNAPDINFYATAHALRTYTDAHDHFPPSLSTLVSENRLKREQLQDPVTGNEFVYVGSDLPTDGSGTLILLYTRSVPEREGRWIGFTDGHIEFFKDSAVPNAVEASNTERMKAKLGKLVLEH